jgi:acetylornithine deacetylase/succinyl-diaminopimelate desuccinylase-like protein
MGLTDAERSVCSAIEAQRDEIVALARALVEFDTTARDTGDPPRQEAAMQEYLARRLSSAGASIDLFEPDADAMQAISTDGAQAAPRSCSAASQRTPGS